MQKTIEVDGLTKYYDKLLAVDHISFSVYQGEIFGFLGPNGAGKTTTQRILTTLLEPSSGSITVNGHNLTRDPYPVKKQMGLVPEESNVYTELSAWSNLMFTAKLYRVPRAERRKRAEELLRNFGLWEKRDVKVDNYSKGMRRRLSIAMAIIHKPRLLFLDEPTPGLDAQSARAIRDLIRRMQEEGTTIFLTTHQIEEASRLCDRVAIIKNGRIAAIDTPELLKQALRRVQSVEVSFHPAQPNRCQALESLSNVSSCLRMGDKWRLYTNEPSFLLPELIDYARREHFSIVSLNTLGPSLEDVFLEITGQKMGTVQHTEEDTAARRPPGKKSAANGKRGGGR